MSGWSSSPWRLPVLSGVLLGLSYVGLPPLLPNFVAFVPILWWLEDNASKPLADRLRGAFLFGVVAYFGILYWMYAMLRFSWLAGILYVGLATIFALFAMTAVTVAARLRRVLRWPWAVSLPAAWIALEWARSFTDVRMTADHLGHTLSPYPFLVQFADLSGPYGVGAFVLAANALAYEWIRRRGEGRRAAAALGVLAAAVLLYDAWAWLHPPTAVRTVRVGFVQPNVPLDVKHGDDTESDQWRTLSLLTRRAAGQGAEIVLWPETARPWRLRHVVSDPRTLAMGETQALARETGAAIVAGVEYLRVPGPAESSFYNAALLVHPDGRIDPAWSAKIYLVPFVEGIPFEPVLGRFLAGRGGEMRWLAGGFTRGPRIEPLPAEKARVGTLICYEELYCDLARRVRNAGSDFIAILTNDAWFGRTRFQWFQANVVRLRAIENRCAFVRVANTGISGFVDPLGRYRDWTDLDTEAVGVRELPLPEGRSAYGVVGDVAAWIALSVAVGGVAWAGAGGGRRARRGRKP